MRLLTGSYSPHLTCLTVCLDRGHSVEFHQYVRKGRVWMDNETGRPVSKRRAKRLARLEDQLVRTHGRMGRKENF